MKCGITRSLEHEFHELVRHEWPQISQAVTVNKNSNGMNYKDVPAKEGFTLES